MLRMQLSARQIHSAGFSFVKQPLGQKNTPPKRGIVCAVQWRLTFSCGNLSFNPVEGCISPEYLLLVVQVPNISYYNPFGREAKLMLLQQLE